MSSADRILPKTTAGPPAPPLRFTAGPQSLLIDGFLAAVYFLLIATWSILIPLGDAPDELNHMFFVDYLAHFGSVPKPHVDPVQPFVGDFTGVELNTSVVWYYGLPFAHVLGAAAFGKFISPLFPGQEYLAVRLFNWMLGGVFFFGLIRALLWSGIRSSAARLITALIATIPQVTFIFAYFNHDAFGLAAVTLSLHAFLRTVRVPDAASSAVYFGSCCGMILLSKPYQYPALLFFILMLLLLWRSDFTFPLRSIAFRAIPACILVSAPILAWTLFQFGDVTGGKMLRYVLSIHPEISSASRDICYVFCKNEVFNWAELGWWFWSSFTSFFGVLGWMDIFLPTEIYLFWFVPLASLFALLAALFIVQRVRRFQSRGARGDLFDLGFVTLTILMLIGTVAMSIFNSQTLQPQAQGRYLFVVLPFTAYCLALFAFDAQARWESGRRAAKSENARRRKLWAQASVVGVLGSLATGMLLLNIYTAIFVVAPVNRAWAGISASLASLLSFSDDLEFNALAKSLTVSGKGVVISIPERSGSVQGWVDILSPDRRGAIQLSGWAFDTERNEPVLAVVLLDKGAAIYVAKIDVDRPDVAEALGTSRASLSGFQTRVWTDPGFDTCSARVLAITRSMEAGELRYAKSVCRRRRLTAQPSKELSR